MPSQSARRGDVESTCPAATDGGAIDRRRRARWSRRPPARSSSVATAHSAAVSPTPTPGPPRWPSCWRSASWVGRTASSRSGSWSCRSSSSPASSWACTTATSCVVRKTTLEEAPTLFGLATLYTLLIWLLDPFLVDGELGRKQVIGLWAASSSASCWAGRSRAPWPCATRARAGPGPRRAHRRRADHPQAERAHRRHEGRGRRADAAAGRHQPRRRPHRRRPGDPRSRRPPRDPRPGQRRDGRDARRHPARQGPGRARQRPAARAGGPRVLRRVRRHPRHADARHPVLRAQPLVAARQAADRPHRRRARPHRRRAAHADHRDRREAGLARPRVLPPGPRRARRPALRPREVPIDGRGGRRPEGRADGAEPGGRPVQDGRRSRASRASGGSCARRRWTSCRSSSTSCAAR